MTIAAFRYWEGPARGSPTGAAGFPWTSHRTCAFFDEMGHQRGRAEGLAYIRKLMDDANARLASQTVDTGGA